MGSAVSEVAATEFRNCDNIESIIFEGDIKLSSCIDPENTSERLLPFENMKSLHNITFKGKIIGVNNRNLHTFEVDTGNSIRLRKMAPEEVVFVSESGIRTPEDIKVLADNQVDAVLIGETLMRSSDKKEMLAYLNRDLG